jgi:alanyl-tRNA synthetase
MELLAKAHGKAQSKLQLQNVGQWLTEIDKETKTFGTKKLWLKQFTELDKNLLKEIADQALNKMGPSSMAFLTNKSADDIQLLCRISNDLVTSGLNAGNIIKQTLALVGGKGGGRPDFAQGGGKDISKLNDAIALVEKALQN